MKKNTITSIDDLLKIIESEKLRNPNNELFFRGQKKKYDTVEPSIGRGSHLQFEDVMFKEFILRNPSEFIEDKTTFQKLARMQHYSLPTRLLDISSNPLVALYFAVEYSEKYENNLGDFILFSIPKDFIKYYDSDTVSAVSNIARRPYYSLDIGRLKKRKDAIESDHVFVKRFNEDSGVRYLHHEIKDEKPYFQPVIEKEHLESIWCVKPLLNNRRIIKQDGAFLLFGINGTKEKLANFNEKHFEPIRYEVENKVLLRDQLNLLGFSKDKIYPELDTTAQYLTELYE